MKYGNINLFWFAVTWLYFSIPLWAAFYGFDWAHRMDAKLAAKRAAKKTGATR